MQRGIVFWGLVTSCEDGRLLPGSVAGLKRKLLRKTSTALALGAEELEARCVPYRHFGVMCGAFQDNEHACWNDMRLR